MPLEPPLISELRSNTNRTTLLSLAIAFAAERDDFSSGNAEEEGPEIRGERSEVAIGAEDVEDLFLGESAAQPGDGAGLPVLQHSLDRVDRVRRWIEVVKVP